MKQQPKTPTQRSGKTLRAFFSGTKAEADPGNSLFPFLEGNGDEPDEDPPPSIPEELPPEEEPTKIPPDEEGWDEPETWPDIPPSPVRDDPPFF